jgi:hypothetical membrane protein
MKPFKRIKTFNDRYPFLGPVFWIVNLQYFIVQILVAGAWSTPYSIFRNTISDLGNTECGEYAARYVCSPLHGIMNASFIILGITMLLGSGLIYHEFKKSMATAIGFSFMAVAGAGIILVGLFPENSLAFFHALGAGLAFLIGNVALLVFALSLDVSIWFRVYTFVSGLVALSALILFVSHIYLGLGQGGMERLTSYPQTIWLIAFGIYMSKDRFSEMATRAAKKLRFSS